MKKVICVFLILLIIFSVFVIFISRSGRALPSEVKKIRIERLRELEKAVERGLKLGQDYDSCLYEIYKDDSARHLLIYISHGQDRENLLEKSNFKNAIDYVLYHNNDKWYIFEKRIDIIYPFYMMIDEKGNINELRPVK
jgi:hypothetical protein